MIFKRIIKTDIPDADKRISKLLHETSVQLSDGYWENEEHWFEEYWNWLEFSDTNGYLTIGILAIPAWDNVKDIFESMSDNEVTKYVADVLDSCWSCAGNDVYKEYNDIIENVISLLETANEPKNDKSENLHAYLCWVPYDEIGWDEYDSCVVIAENEKEAMKICMNNESILLKNNNTVYSPIFHKGSNIHIEKIDMTKKGIICASFNAG